MTYKMKQNQGFFVTGTDTGVGKTVVTSALVSILRNAGIDTVPMKPVQTGCRRRGNRWYSPDLESCLSLTGLSVSKYERSLMSPYCFEKESSPHLAAQAAGTTIKLDRIRKSFQMLQKKHEAVVVEGIGGVLVPLNRKKTILDLMLELNLPVILVSRPTLGTLNHTFLSLNELRRANLTVFGIIFNDSELLKWGDIETDNYKFIKSKSATSIMGRLPFIKNLSHIARSGSNEFYEHCFKHLPGVSRCIKLIQKA